MTSLLSTWRFRLVTVALIAGAFLGWIALQQIVTVTAHAAEKTTTFKPVLNQLKGSVKAPPDIQALKDTAALPTKIRTVLSQVTSSTPMFLKKCPIMPGG